MTKLYRYFGGRKVFWGFAFSLMLYSGAFCINTENYRTFEAGLFALYASMVLGNVATKFVNFKTGNTNETP